MDVLKKCQKAEIYLADELICIAEVFRDLNDEIWLSIPKDLSLEEPEYTIIFFDSIAGLLRCRCALKEVQPLTDEWDSVPCTILEVLDTQQRRQDLKISLETNLELTCTYVPGSPSNIPMRIAATTRDISAGGIYFICDYCLPEDTVVQFQLHGASKPLLLAAKVLRFEAIESTKGQTQYGHGCMFIELRPQSEAVLRNYIFRQERQRRR